MCSKFILLFATVFFLLTGPATAMNPFDVVAVVESEAITVHDVEARTDLMIFSAGLPNTTATRNQMRNQVFNSLVDEALQRQEAKDEGITVTEEDIDRGVENIAQQNKMSREEFENKLKQNKIELSTMRAQVESRALWTKFSKKKFGAFVKISEAEIDDELNTIKTKATEDNYLLAEIFIPVDQTADDEKSKQLSMQVLNEMRQGKPFSIAAKEYSQSATAKLGGDMGWVAAGQLSPAIASVITQVTTGQVSPPIKTDEGYYLIMVRDKRQPAQEMGGGESLELYQILLSPADPQKPEQQQAMFALTAKAKDQIKSCPDAEMFSTSASSGIISHGNIGFVGLGDMPPELRTGLQNAAINQTVGPLSLNGRPALFTVCNKKIMEAQLPSRDQVANKLKQEFISRRAQQYLLELRRSAIIDIRQPNQG